MACTASEASAPPQLLSENAEKHCAADIYALHHRLGRCVKQVERLTSSSAGGSSLSHHKGGRSSASCVRRLGELLREARRLEKRVTEASLTKTGSAQETAELADDVVASPLQAYYRQELQARLTHLQHDADTAQRLLAQYLSQTPTLVHLPVSCVGTVPRTLECGLTAVATTSFGRKCHVYVDVVPPHAACIPPAAVHFIEGASPAAADVQDSSLVRGSVSQTKEEPGVRERKNSAAASFAGHPLGTSSAVGAAITAEDRIMEDIQQAIHQMKDGALQMSALMEQEKAKMKSAADLLSDGVAKGQTHMHELDRVSYVAEAAHVPWMLRFVPGMPILWRTVLQPMWAFLKQVLVMASIIAVTGCVLLLISVVPKPTVYRGQRRRTHDNCASPPQSTAASATVPVTAAAPPPSEVHVSPPTSYEAEEPVAMESPAPAKTAQEVSTPSPHEEDLPAEFLADL
ncbi:conserved hypothetical protein [Leishmania major strain Friedlin]|uniref:Hypothetical transmembrane protein P883.20 n=1 Tax=Leishmania major TaxID=5664 RepID=Q9BHF0_LEIMA|nr:conserved hypothetical protein [Leishmania major strain Friedlin]CAC37217.1 hypothetical transmembrane protein P883.20 [Leishmania major]CAG9579214.1 hypothetical_protein_-_conserved [Leishmania major strain Friedlin]CAJ08247.1 conserved hypothetical protein [Leishmania major strain Friedlin]|eukprot:XP_001685045.1 conserved hypothetical protein [Leishmania major strain Friedlin]